MVAIVFGFLFLIAIGIAVVLSIVLKEIKEKQIRFIYDNSQAVATIKRINEKYKFYPPKLYQYTHTYDNKIFYDSISCQDYLIYQLQTQSSQITEDIKKIHGNQLQYKEYLAELKDQIHLGEFRNPIQESQKERLLKTEKEVLSREKLTPAICFEIKVFLNRSDLGGRIYERKTEVFREEQILNLIDRVNNKYGAFFQDREIWDSICRVERGRVSNKLRFYIYKRDGYRCRICGRSQRSGYLEVDHIYPVSKGGKSTADNLQTLCHECNVRKGNKTDWYPQGRRW